MKLVRYRVVVREIVMAAMKGRVETSDLRQRRKVRKKRFDRCQIVRLVKRRQGTEALELRHDAVIDQCRPVIVGSTMNNAVTHRQRRNAKFVA